MVDLLLQPEHSERLCQWNLTLSGPDSGIWWICDAAGLNLGSFFFGGLTKYIVIMISASAICISQNADWAVMDFHVLCMHDLQI